MLPIKQEMEEFLWMDVWSWYCLVDGAIGPSLSPTPSQAVIATLLCSIKVIKSNEYLWIAPRSYPPDWEHECILCPLPGNLNVSVQVGRLSKDKIVDEIPIFPFLNVKPNMCVEINFSLRSSLWYIQATNWIMYDFTGQTSMPLFLN